MCVISDSELISWFVIKYRFFLYCIRQSKKLLKNLNAMTELIKVYYLFFKYSTCEITLISKQYKYKNKCQWKTLYSGCVESSFSSLEISNQ